MLRKDGSMSEDDVMRAKTEMEKIVQRGNKKLDELLQRKSKRLQINLYIELVSLMVVWCNFTKSNDNNYHFPTSTTLWFYTRARTFSCGSYVWYSSR